MSQILRRKVGRKSRKTAKALARETKRVSLLTAADIGFALKAGLSLRPNKLCVADRSAG
jgi:hypothetical protein